MNKSVVVHSDEAISASFSHAKNYAANAAQAGDEAVTQAVLCGIELLQLQKHSGITHGGDRKSSGHCGHLIVNFEEIVEKECGISSRTARRWMQLARWYAPALGLGRDRFDFHNDEHREYAEQKLREIIAGRSIRQLLKPLANDDDAERFLRFHDLADQGDKLAQEKMSQWEDGKLPDLRAVARAVGGAKATKNKSRQQIDPRRSATQSGTNFVKLIDTWESHDAGTQKEIRKQVGKLLDSLKFHPDAVPRSHRPDSENLADAQKISNRNE